MIPPLLPDVTFDVLGQNGPDTDFAFEAKKQALGPHVAARWGWDDALQLEIHQQRQQEKVWYRILVAAQPAGTVSWQVLADHVRLGEFYLLDGFRGRGLGTRILVHLLGLADAAALSVRLEYLKWNPVGALYRRHGFVDERDTEFHHHLLRPPRPARLSTKPDETP